MADLTAPGRSHHASDAQPAARAVCPRNDDYQDDYSGALLGISDKILAKRLQGASFSDLEQFAETVARQYVLALPNANIKKLTLDTLDRWKDEHVTKNGKRLPR